MGFFDVLKVIGRKWGDVERGASSLRGRMHGYSDDVITREADRLARLRAELEAEQYRKQKRFEVEMEAAERARESEQRTRRTDQEKQRERVAQLLDEGAIPAPPGEEGAIGGSHIRPDLDPSETSGMTPGEVADIWGRVVNRKAASRLKTQAEAEAKAAEEERKNDREYGEGRRGAREDYDYRRAHPMRQPETEDGDEADPEYARAERLILSSDRAQVIPGIGGGDPEIRTQKVDKRGKPMPGDIDPVKLDAKVRAWMQKTPGAGRRPKRKVAAPNTRAPRADEPVQLTPVEEAKLKKLPPGDRLEFVTLMGSGDQAKIEEARARLASVP